MADQLPAIRNRLPQTITGCQKALKVESVKAPTEPAGVQQELVRIRDRIVEYVPRVFAGRKIGDDDGLRRHPLRDFSAVKEGVLKVSKTTACALVYAGLAVQACSAQIRTPIVDEAGFAQTFKHQRAVVNGVRLHYVLGGKGPLLVLIHGFPASWYEWRRVMPSLAQVYTVLAVDIRGLGDSSKPAGGYDTRTVAEDIHQLVHSVGFNRAFVAGHDWGAAVGFAYAMTYPEEVQRLAILDMMLPGFGYEEAMQITRAGGAWHLGFQMTPDVPEMLVTGRERQYLSIFYSGQYGSGDDPNAIPPEEVDEYVRVYTKPGALRAGFSYYRACFQDADQNREGTKIKMTMPVLFLGGERTIAVKSAERLREGIANLRIRIVPRAGHWVIHDAPDFIVEGLLSFFSEVK